MTLQDYQLDEEELAIQQEMDVYVEANKGKLGQWKEAEILRMTKFAQDQYEATKKTKQITIRLNERDLIKLKSKAITLGIPYQTLIGSQIRQFVNS